MALKGNTALQDCPANPHDAISHELNCVQNKSVQNKSIEN